MSFRRPFAKNWGPIGPHNYMTQSFVAVPCYINKYTACVAHSVGVHR